MQMLSQSLSTVITSWALSGFQFFGETGWAPRAVLRWPGWQENPTASDMGREELFSTVDMILASDCLSIRLVLAGRHRSLHRPLQPPTQCHLDPWQPGPAHQRRPALQVACLQPPDSGRGWLRWFVFTGASLITVVRIRAVRAAAPRSDRDSALLAHQAFLVLPRLILPAQQRRALHILAVKLASEKPESVSVGRGTGPHPALRPWGILVPHARTPSMCVCLLRDRRWRGHACAECAGNRPGW